jgi:hypothetical protein
MLAATTDSTDPKETRINEFLIQAEQGHAHGLANVHAVHARYRTATGTGAASKTQIRILTGDSSLLAFAEYQWLHNSNSPF